MREQNDFEKAKIYKASTNKVVCNVYLDSFGIEKVRIQNFTYEDKSTISCYLDFPQISALANDINTGSIFKRLQGGESITLHMGGTTKSQKYNGAPEFRTLSISMSGDKIFLNMTAGKGILGETGLIKPTKEIDTKIGVPMSIQSFKELVLYTHDCINAFLAHHIYAKYQQIEQAKREANYERHQ